MGPRPSGTPTRSVSHRARASDQTQNYLAPGTGEPKVTIEVLRLKRSGKKTTAQISSLSRRGVVARGVLVSPVTPHKNPGSPVAAVAWAGAARASIAMPARALMMAVVRRFGF
jgi:hypothetical protein